MRLGVVVPGTPQIPWARETKVLRVTADKVELERSPRFAEIDACCDDFRTDSFAIIGDWMAPDVDLTADLERYVKECADGVMVEDCIERWIKAEPLEPPPLRGVKEWAPRPRIALHKPWKIGTWGHWKIGTWGQGNTRHLDNWAGSEFGYTHFEMPKGMEGLVIQRAGADREVWTGDVYSFMIENEDQDYSDPDVMRALNDWFENGLLWAYERLGLFDEEPERLPSWVPQVIKDDPDLLWPDLVERLAPIVDRLPTELADAVRQWLARRRREWEREAGQQYFWRGLEGRSGHA
jgi:hypothetical protein